MSGHLACTASGHLLARRSGTSDSTVPRADRANRPDDHRGLGSILRTTRGHTYAANRPSLISTTRSA